MKRMYLTDPAFILTRIIPKFLKYLTDLTELVRNVDWGCNQSNIEDALDHIDCIRDAILPSVAEETCNCLLADEICRVIRVIHILKPLTTKII